MPNIDYSNKMPGTIFSYDEDFYTDDLPDPQIDPVLPGCLLYTSPSPRDRQKSRMPSSA